jgi:hypothetical protein
MRDISDRPHTEYLPWSFGKTSRGAERGDGPISISRSIAELGEARFGCAGSRSCPGSPVGARDSRVSALLRSSVPTPPQPELGASFRRDDPSERTRRKELTSVQDCRAQLQAGDRGITVSAHPHSQRSSASSQNVGITASNALVLFRSSGPNVSENCLLRRCVCTTRVGVVSDFFNDRAMTRRSVTGFPESIPATRSLSVPSALHSMRSIRHRSQHFALAVIESFLLPRSVGSLTLFKTHVTVAVFWTTQFSFSSAAISRSALFCRTFAASAAGPVGVASRASKARLRAWAHRPCSNALEARWRSSSGVGGADG